MEHLVVTILPNKCLLEPNNPRRKNFYLEIRSAVLKRSRIQYFYSEVLSRSLAKFLIKSSTITTYNEIQTKFWWESLKTYKDWFTYPKKCSRHTYGDLNTKLKKESCNWSFTHQAIIRNKYGSLKVLQASKGATTPEGSCNVSSPV